jgi:hypothetical protein
MPTRSTAFSSTSNAVSASHTARTSTGTSAVPPLSSGSSRKSSTSSANTDLASDLGGVQLLEEDLDGVLVVPSTRRSTCNHPCLFHVLACNENFDEEEEWKVHVLSHFRGNDPPTEAQCPLCSWKLANSTPSKAWVLMLHHVAIDHFKHGHTLATSRPDFALYKFLYNRKILNEPQYKALFMTPVSGPYDQRQQLPPSEIGQSNEPFVSTASDRQQRPLNRTPGQGPASRGPPRRIR